MYGQYPEDNRQVIAAGASAVADAYGPLLEVRNEIEAAIATLNATTRASRSDAPGRALMTLMQVTEQLAQAMTYLEESTQLAEQWADNL